MAVRRVLLAVLACVAVLLLPASPAAAHSVGGVGATNFRTTLSALTPAVPGVTLRVIENGSKLELSNTTGTDVVVAGYSGEPYARVGPAGVFLNDNSPATYLNADRYSSVPVPAGVDPKGPPRWRQVSGDPLFRWHDHRVHWMLTTLPPQVAADPGTEHRISSWTVLLTYGQQPLTATGTLDWVPGPSPWPWFLLAGLVALAVALLRSRIRPLGVFAGAMVVADVLHGVGVMIVTTGTLPERLGALFGADALLIWPFGILAAVLLWRRSSRAVWLAAAVGAVIASTIVVDDAPDLWRSSSPTQWPLDVNRALVALVIGSGIGLILALVVTRLAAAGGVGALSTPRQADSSDDLDAPAGVPSARTASDDAEPSISAGSSAGAGSSVGAGSSRRAGWSGRSADLGLPDGDGPAGVGRREVAGMLAAGALGALAGTAGGLAIGNSRRSTADAGPGLSDVGARTVAFYGERQAGIVTPVRQQAHVWVAGLDLVPGVDAARLRSLLRSWTAAGATLAQGRPLGAVDDPVVAGLGPSALTVTVGFGPSLFGKAGLPVTLRPEALAPLPSFAGERLDPLRSDGDLGLVVAADDPLVVVHTSRVLRRLAAGVATVRWEQVGFNSARGSGSETATGRNLMGQLDGTNNPKPADPDFAERIFATGPAWLNGGSYLVVRRIRMLLDAWDAVPVAAQERVIGRRKDTGAPLSGGTEQTPSNFGSAAIPVNAHIRLANPAFNQGAAMLRRGFSYVDGAESGLLFLAWQADPRRGFIPVQQHLVGVDALGRYIRHETSALFAMPSGASTGSYVGAAMLEGL